jgi:hypothetical protein
MERSSLWAPTLITRGNWRLSPSVLPLRYEQKFQQNESSTSCLFGI